MLLELVDSFAHGGARRFLLGDGLRIVGPACSSRSGLVDAASKLLIVASFLRSLYDVERSPFSSSGISASVASVHGGSPADLLQFHMQVSNVVGSRSPACSRRLFGLARVPPARCALPELNPLGRSARPRPQLA
jgi:hypothetical protein